MARRSSGGRSSRGFLGSRSASKPSKPVPAPAPAKAPTPIQTGSTIGGLGSVVAEGMAFGGGSTIAHTGVDAVAGSRVVHHETVPSATPVAAHVNAIPETCGRQYKAFQDCLESSASDIGKCQFYKDMLMQCRKAPFGLMAY